MMDEHWHKGLTEKQRRFVEAFTASGNATEAARRAGYRYPQAQGAETLRRPAVAAAIEALRAEETAAAIAERHERQAYWTAVMRGEPDAEGNRPTISERLRASEILGKAQGDFIERREVTGQGAVELQPGQGLSAILAEAEKPEPEES